MRFTLSKLFIAVAMLALACAGMIYRNRWWTDAIITLTVLLFAVMALRAIGLRGRDRVFAIAFSVVGTVYLVLTMTDLCQIIGGSLPSNHVLAAAWKLTQGVGDMPLESVLAIRPISREDPFFIIGHCVSSWLFALVAGWFAGI